MEVVFKAPHALVDVPMHYCPGCTHGLPTDWWQKP
jgi:2-oxoglutarate ferredoxin oxidoreductase subunit beta